MSALDSPLTGADATTIQRMGELLERQRKAFIEAGAPAAEQRIASLDRLIGAVLSNEAKIVAALREDFGHRSDDLSRWTDVAAIVENAKYARKRLRSWMKPSRRSPMFPMGFFGARAEVRYQPLGVVGIVSPWNFPVYLAFGPLVGALAAGNRALIKPSEVTPACADVIASICRATFDELEVSVVTGGPEVGSAFTRLPFDHLLFTGGTSIGRHVMRAAADNLVPVTLELGGKCPVIVAPDADLTDVATKVVNGKCMNAGQVCLAPDYLLVPKGREAAVVEAMKVAMATLYPTLVENPDYTSVVNTRHRRRVGALLDDATAKGATAVELNPAGEEFDAAKTNKMPVTVLLGVDDSMTVMQDEIFGPLLPIVPYDSITQAVAYVNARPRPLALYYFGPSTAERERVLAATTSGGVTVNDIALHVVQDDLPFGGVGPSGMGVYHGPEGFRTFSHARSVFHQARWDVGKMLRPPFGDTYRKVIASMLKP